MDYARKDIIRTMSIPLMIGYFILLVLGILAFIEQGEDWLDE